MKTCMAKSEEAAIRLKKQRLDQQSFQFVQTSRDTKTKKTPSETYFCGCGFESQHIHSFQQHVQVEHGSQCLPDSSHFLSSFFKIVLPVKWHAFKKRTPPDSDFKNVLREHGSYVEYISRLKLTPNHSYKSPEAYFCGQCFSKQQSSGVMLDHMLNKCQTTQNPNSSHFIQEIEWDEQLDEGYINFQLYMHPQRNYGFIEKIYRWEHHFLIRNLFVQPGTDKSSNSNNFHCGLCRQRTLDPEEFIEHARSCRVNSSQQSSFFVVPVESITINGVYARSKGVLIDGIQTEFQLHLNQPRPFSLSLFYCGSCGFQTEIVEPYAKHVVLCGSMLHSANSHHVRLIEAKEGNFSSRKTTRVKHKPVFVGSGGDYFCGGCSTKVYLKTYLTHMTARHNETVPRGSSHVVIRTRDGKRVWLMPKQGEQFIDGQACLCSNVRMGRREWFVHMQCIHMGISPPLNSIPQEAQ